MITYNTDGVAMPKLKKRIINRWIKQVAATYGRKVGDIGYMFVDDAKILQVNNEYLGHDYYTDIITFDYDEDNIVSGDLVISIDTVKSNGLERNMKTNSIVSSSMAYCIFVALTTKDRVNAK